MFSRAAAIALLCAGVGAGAAAAAEFPSKPVRLILGFPPGGATDLVARAMQPRMSAALGHQLVIDNRPGANGIIAGELTARADPDGHIGVLVISPAIQKLPFDPIKDFAPIGQAVSLQNILITHPTLAARTTREFIAYAKSNPGKINYASSGIGSPGHLAAVLLESMAKIQITHIPYKGGGPAITDLLAGHVPAFFAVISTGVPHVQAGKVRGIAVTGTRRAEAVPDVPTIAESGVPGYAATNWYGLLAPAKTPSAVIDRINRDMTASLKSPDVIENLKARGIDAAPNSPAEFATFIRAESEKWRPIVRQSGIKPDGG